MKDFNDLMMESFIELAAEMSRAAGFKKGEFAQKLWPQSDPRVAVNRWRWMRSQVKITGKPQGLLVSDAQRIATALNQNLAYMFVLAQDRATKKLTAQETGQKKIAPPQEKKGRGGLVRAKPDKTA
jgi:hypothetical protein